MVASRGVVPVVVLWLLALVAGCGDPERAVVSIEVALQAPRTTSLLATRTQQATATATYNDDTTEDVTQQVEWSSSNPAVATVNGGGLVTGVAVGATSISATYRQFMDAVVVNVDPAILTGIDITGPSNMVPDGLFLQLTATGTFSDGTTRDITTTATWASNMTSIATVDATGEVEGIAVGNATITATQGTISDPFALTVSGGVLTGITLTPDNNSQPEGRVVQYTAMGQFSDGVNNDITLQASWTSSAPAIASVNNTTTKGLVTFEEPGTATITATFGGFNDIANLTVANAVVDSIVITPLAPAPLPLGLDLQFTCTATLSDGTMDDCTNDCAWTSSLPGVASIDGNGLVTASNSTLGTTKIDCDYLTFTDDVDLVVTNASLESIVVSPDNEDIPIGLPIEYTAIGTFSNGTILDVTNTATWTTTPSNRLSITSSGIATSQPGTIAGPCTVRATIGTVNDVANCNLTAGVVTSIDLTPSNTTLPITQTQQYTATGNFSDGFDYDLTQHSNWTSTAPAIASISNAAGSKGLVSALAAGTTTIGATFATITGTTQLTIDPPPAPEIQFLLSGSPFGSGGTNNLGGALTLGVAVPFTFTIQNLGTSNLTLGTSTFTTQTGCMGAFTTPAPVSPLAPNATTTINGTVTPTAAGSINCTFSTPNNDTTGGENPYLVQLTGSTAAPEIGIATGSASISDGGVDRVFSEIIGVPFTRTYTVTNTGSANLTLGAITFPMSSNCVASVQTPPGTTTVGLGSSTTFSITVTPTAIGSFSCQFAIANNDSNENPYNVDIHGVGARDTGNFANADGIYDGDTGCGFGTFTLTSGLELVLSNLLGNGPLVFLLTSAIQASASGVVVFSIGNHICTITRSGAGFTISMSCSNTSGGSCFESFSRRAAPEIHVASVNIGDELHSGVDESLWEILGVGRPSADWELRISNVGDAPLNLGAITFTNDINCNATLQVPPGMSTLAPGAATTLTVRVTPVANGPFLCTARIASNDSDENPFVVGFPGQAF